MTTPVPEPDQQPAGQKPDEAVEEVKPSLVARRREKIRAEVHQARHGDHLVPTWVLTVILVVIVVGWAYLVYSA
ncbi:hypothetical protein ACWEOZ_18335 [Actinoplanes sp. NPDC004185]